MHRNLPVVILGLLLTGMLSSPAAAAQTPESGTEDHLYEYRLLATKKTSTMRKEMNRAAEDGFRFETVMGGKTSFGGSQVVVIMSRPVGSEASARYQYQLLATSKTSTMQKEMRAAAAQGFVLVGLTVSKTRFGGSEVVTIMRRRVAQ